MKRTGVQYHGLINHGSTCYLNSVLQVLFMTREFRDAVNRFVEENPDTEFIDRHLKDLFDDLLRRTTSPHRIIQALGINRVCERQDAAEYLEKILRLTSPDSAKIFHGQMAHRTTCCECKTESDRDGAFWHLPLELLDSSRGNDSVEEGIKMFFRASELGGENQMYCNECDEKVNATSKYIIKHHPDVLILLLKRFDFSHQHMSFIKVNRSVDLPSTFKLQETQKYELYAVVAHFGDLRSGHYVTFIKSQDDGERWYSFDDTKVSALGWNPFPDNANRTRLNEAYLLFYRRKEEAATGTEEEPMEVCMYEDQSAASQTQKGLSNSECGEPQDCPTGPIESMEETRALDTQRSPRTREPQGDHHRSNRNPRPGEAQRITPQGPPNSCRARAPGGPQQRTYGPHQQPATPGQIQPGPRDPRPEGTLPPAGARRGQRAGIPPSSHQEQAGRCPSTQPQPQRPTNTLAGKGATHQQGEWQGEDKSTPERGQGEMISTSAASSSHPKLNNALNRLSEEKWANIKQKNETEGPDSQVQRHHKEGGRNVLSNSKYKEQSGGEYGLKSAAVENRRINSYVKEKRKGRSESDGADSQEVSSAAGEVKGRAQSDHRLRRNSSRDKKREKKVNRTDESHQRKLDEFMKESHPDEGLLDQEKHISGSHKTQRNASKRQNKKQKTGGGESQRRPGSETSERLKQNQRAEEEETELENDQTNSIKKESETSNNIMFDSTYGTKNCSPTRSGSDVLFLPKQQKHKTEKNVRKRKIKKKTNQSDGLETFSNVELDSDKGKTKQKKKSSKTKHFFCFGGNESN